MPNWETLQFFVFSKKDEKLMVATLLPCIFRSVCELFVLHNFSRLNFTAVQFQGKGGFQNLNNLSYN